MKLLVTAGNTAVPIDRVRQITNVATGRTGAAIARHAHDRGHSVTLVTSRPEAVEPPAADVPGFRVVPYQTFDELMAAMQSAIRTDAPDALIHSAAVNDYQVAGVYALAPGTRARGSGEGIDWEVDGEGPPRLIEITAGKVKSGLPELWLRLAPTPKNTNILRSGWGFRGTLVLFKLEVGVDEAGLTRKAEALRERAKADLMVANSLETAAEWAFLGPLTGGYRRVPRAELPEQLLAVIEALHRERGVLKK